MFAVKCRLVFARVLSAQLFPPSLPPHLFVGRLNTLWDDGCGGGC